MLQSKRSRSIFASEVCRCFRATLGGHRPWRKIMKARSIAAIPGVLLVCCAVSNPVLAKDNCRGYVVGLGSARVVIQDDRTLPMHLASGECTSTGASTSKCTF